jgi:hypothetical protein|tara:strand:+ start:402 stop:1190 length:789 start_codon:yes stop_codon:yes gene_type:complete
MKTINRKKLIAENLLREHVRKRILNSFKKQQLFENALRKHIRKLLETETGTEEASEHTGINVLADLLKNIIPTLEDDYKMLTTAPEQRESFRNHVIHAVKNSLNPIETFTSAEKNEAFVYEIDKSILLEKMVVDLDPEDGSGESVEGEFIDIDVAEDEPDFGSELEGQNETGRNFASESFKRVEKQIVDAYDMLADEKDQKLFYDYLLTNLMLYFDKFEDELTEDLPDITTPEYEKAVDEDENEIEDELDLEPEEVDTAAIS